MTMSEMLAVAVPAAAVLVWLIRLEGRVNTHEALNRQMRDDIGYIRSRIDKALNGYEHE
jgi:hypothetical protein